MAATTCVEKSMVVAALRSRDLHDRADWVERQLPALIDAASNAALLRMLGIDLDTLTPDAGTGDVAGPGPTGRTPAG